MKAVITGAARGIGAAIARRLASDGYEVVGVDLSASDGIHACDISDWAAVASVAKRVGSVDVLVNNAAIRIFGRLEEVDPVDFKRVLDVNLIGAFHCMKAFGRSMVDRGGGAIVNIASGAGGNPNPGGGAYASSKAGMIALTKQAAIEWGPRGVRVNAVSPGFTPTEGSDAYSTAELWRERSSNVPLRRLGTPEDVAEVVAFLVSDRAAYINAVDVAVDGGLLAAVWALAGPSLTEAVR
jgi:NAD(P)-dependent dehydrogenase (short-subunit alcohol dehydrogenase family)